MDPLASYILPIGGMDIGKHAYDFKVDAYFLNQFENSPITDADVDVTIEVDRRTTLAVLDISLAGHIHCACDRCTAPITLPVSFTHQVFLKDKEGVDSQDDDIIFINLEQATISVSNLLYDLFLLAIPIQKTYDCEQEEKRPCDEDILARLDQDDDDENLGGSSIWDELKKEII